MPLINAMATATSLPSEQHAVKSHSGSTATLTTVPVPSPNPNQLLIKTAAVALNPSEWMILDWYSVPGVTLGSDYSGTVVEVGKDVVGWKVGDRVAGFIAGGVPKYPNSGAFAQYMAVDADFAVHIPEKMGFEEAATLGMGVLTAAQALFHDPRSLKLPLPVEGANVAEKPTVMVYGGGTPTGAFAIQLATAAGAKVITTASLRHKDYLLSLGAVAVFDYNDPTAPTQIKAFTNNNLSLVVDCIGTSSTASFCMSCVRPKEVGGGTYVSLIAVPDDVLARPDFENYWTLVHTLIGEDVQFGNTPEAPVYPGLANGREFAKRVWKVVEGLLEKGAFRGARFERGEGGLGGIPEGIGRVREKKVSGKLVYCVG